MHTVVPTREGKLLLKSEIKTYLDRAEEIALLLQVCLLAAHESHNTASAFHFQKPTPKLPDHAHGLTSSTVNSSKLQLPFIHMA